MEGLTNNGEHHRGTEMPQEMDIISAEIEIGENLNTATAIICLRIVSVVMVFGLGT